MRDQYGAHLNSKSIAQTLDHSFGDSFHKIRDNLEFDAELEKSGDFVITSEPILWEMEVVEEVEIENQESDLRQKEFGNDKSSMDDLHSWYRMHFLRYL